MRTACAVGSGKNECMAAGGGEIFSRGIWIYVTVRRKKAAFDLEVWHLLLTGHARGG